MHITSTFESGINYRAADDTKHVIVQTAMRMFAERGIEGVSLSELRSASGQNNRSAIHYHFGNKEGLLDAVSKRLAEVMDPPMRESVAEGRELASAGLLTVDDFIRVFSRPYISLYNSNQEGRNCILMLSHLCHEPAERQRARAFAPLQRYMDDMVQLLHTLLPRRGLSDLAPLLFLCACSIVESLICSGMLTREHTLAGNAVQAPASSALIAMTLAFAKGGLMAASQDASLSPG